MQDARLVRRSQLMFPWKRFALRVAARPEAILERLELQLFKPSLFRFGRPISSPEGSVHGNRFEVFTEWFRWRAVLEGEVIGAAESSVVRLLVRPSRLVLLSAGAWIFLATVLAVPLTIRGVVEREPMAWVAAAVPLFGYGLAFGGLPTAAVRAIRWLTDVAEGNPVRD